MPALAIFIPVNAPVLRRAEPLLPLSIPVPVHVLGIGHGLQMIQVIHAVLEATSGLPDMIDSPAGRDGLDKPLVGLAVHGNDLAAIPKLAVTALDDRAAPGPARISRAPVRVRLEPLIGRAVDFRALGERVAMPVQAHQVLAAQAPGLYRLTADLAGPPAHVPLAQTTARWFVSTAFNRALIFFSHKASIGTS